MAVILNASEESIQTVDVATGAVRIVTGPERSSTDMAMLKPFVGCRTAKVSSFRTQRWRIPPTFN